MVQFLGMNFPHATISRPPGLLDQMRRRPLGLPQGRQSPYSSPHFQRMAADPRAGYGSAHDEGPLMRMVRQHRATTGHATAAGGADPFPNLLRHPTVFQQLYVTGPTYAGHGVLKTNPAQQQAIRGFLFHGNTLPNSPLANRPAVPSIAQQLTGQLPPVSGLVRDEPNAGRALFSNAGATRDPNLPPPPVPFAQQVAGVRSGEVLNPFGRYAVPRYGLHGGQEGANLDLKLGALRGMARRNVDSMNALVPKDYDGMGSLERMLAENRTYHRSHGAVDPLSPLAGYPTDVPQGPLPPVGHRTWRDYMTAPQSSGGGPVTIRAQGSLGQRMLGSTAAAQQNSPANGDARTLLLQGYFPPGTSTMAQRTAYVNSLPPLERMLHGRYAFGERPFGTETVAGTTANGGISLGRGTERVMNRGQLMQMIADNQAEQGARIAQRNLARQTGLPSNTPLEDLVAAVREQRRQEQLGSSPLGLAGASSKPQVDYSTFTPDKALATMSQKPQFGPLAEFLAGGEGGPPSLEEIEQYISSEYPSGLPDDVRGLLDAFKAGIFTPGQKQRYDFRHPDAEERARRRTKFHEETFGRHGGLFQPGAPF